MTRSKPALTSATAATSPSAVGLSVRRTSVVQGAKRFLFKKELKEKQVGLVTTAAVKNRTTRVLLITLFIDISGVALLSPCYPSMCANAPGAADLGEVPGAFPASNFAFAAQATAPPALDYALTIGLIPISLQLGSSFSSYIAGSLSDRFGRKLVIQGCLLGGVLSYMMIFAAGFWMRNYWFFLASKFLLGLFNGSKPVVTSYLQDIHDPADFQARVQPQLIMVALFGMMGGSILALLWVSVANAIPGYANTSISLFGPVLLGAALSASAALVVHLYCPEPAKKEPAAARDGKQHAISKTTRTVLVIILVAGSFDAFGDQGNVFARSTILSNRYPAGRQPVINALLMVTNIGSVVIASQLVQRSVKRLGMGMRGFGIWTVLGNLASATVHFTLLVIIWYDDAKQAMGAFVCVWLLNQVVGICSTLAAYFVWTALIPADRRGQMNGLRGSVTSLTNCVAFLVLALVYQTGSIKAPVVPGAANETALNLTILVSNDNETTIVSNDDGELSALDQAAVTCLALCGSISFLALVSYLPLTGMLPKTPPTAAPPSLKREDSKKGMEAAPEILQPLEYYDSVPYAEWSKMPLAVRIQIHKERRAKGMPKKVFPWGSWQDDLPIAGGILKRARAEFLDLHQIYTHSLTNDAELEKAVAAHKLRRLKEEEPDEKARIATARREMGEWMSDYLDDAGYDVGWKDTPYIVKAMIMTAFPPLDPLDDQKATYDNPEELRTAMLNFLRVLDLHISNAKSEDLIVDNHVSLAEASISRQLSQ